MNPWMQVPEKTPGKFRVGDRVHLLYGFPGVIAEVVEDRGRIGAGGRRLHTVKLHLEEGNDFITDRGEEELEAVAE